MSRGLITGIFFSLAGRRAYNQRGLQAAVGSKHK